MAARYACSASANRPASCSSQPRFTCASTSFGSSVDRFVRRPGAQRPSRLPRDRCRGRTSRSPALRRRGLALHDAQRAVGRVALEREQVLPRLRLPAAAAFLHHDAIGDRADGQARQRHRLGQVAAQLAHRARDALRRNVGLDQRLRGAQHDQVLEREAPRVARAARGRDEAGVDQRADRAARQAQQLLDVAHAVRMHRAARCAIATSSRPCAAPAPPAARALRGLASFGGPSRLRRLRRRRRLLLEARAQRFHQVDHLRAAGFGRLGHRDLLALDLLLDRRLDARRAPRRCRRVGSNVSEACCSISCCASFNSASLTSVFGMSTSLIERTSPAYSSCCITRPSFDRADHHDVLLAARGPAAERAALRLAQRARRAAHRAWRRPCRARGNTPCRSTPGRSLRAARTR